MADDNVLKTIILTLKKDNVLIPSAVVAEIISVEELESVENSPDWLMGKFQWRGESIPLLSFEAASEGGVATAKRSKQVAVLYVLNADSAMGSPYIGLVISGVPHVSRFSADQIKADEAKEANHPMLAQHIKVNGVSMSILDIDAMEAMVSEVGI